MTLRTKNIRDVIAALQQIVREHGSDLYVDTMPDDEKDEEDDAAIEILDVNGGHIARVWLNCAETDSRLLEAVTRIPNAPRKTKQHRPR